MTVSTWFLTAALRLAIAGIPVKAAEQQQARDRLQGQSQGEAAPETLQGWRTAPLQLAAASGLGTLLLAPQSSQHAQAWERTPGRLHAAVQAHAIDMLQSSLCPEIYHRWV